MTKTQAPLTALERSILAAVDALGGKAWATDVLQKLNENHDNPNRHMGQFHHLLFCLAAAGHITVDQRSAPGRRVQRYVIRNPNAQEGAGS